MNHHSLQLFHLIPDWPEVINNNSKPSGVALSHIYKPSIKYYYQTFYILHPSTHHWRQLKKTRILFSSVKYNFASRKRKLVHALIIIGKTRSLHGYHNSFLPDWKGLLNLLTITITTIFINFLFPITHNYSDLHGSYFVMLRNRQCERNLSTLDAFQSWCWMLLRKKKNSGCF